MTRIAAVVLSLPERHELLKEALDSIHNQNRPPDDLLVGVDDRFYGEADNLNRLINATDCDWIAVLHDDDLWRASHLAVIEETIEKEDPHVVFSKFNLIGRPQNTIEPWHDNFQDFEFTNWVGSPSMVVFKKFSVGYWINARRPSEDPWFVPNNRMHSDNSFTDWTNYRSWLHRGLKMSCTNLVTVDYRFGDWGNGSWSQKSTSNLTTLKESDTLVSDKMKEWFS